MSGLKEQYIAAGAELIAEKTDIDKVISGLKKAMAQRGHTRLLTSVLKGLASKVERESEISVPQLTVATKDAGEMKASSTKNALVKIDPTIIGGYIIREGFTRTDNSHKTKLLNWYRKATSSI
jgi:F0F1-type ATP synthase delta subunit